MAQASAAVHEVKAGRGFGMAFMVLKLIPIFLLMLEIHDIHYHLHLPGAYLKNAVFSYGRQALLFYVPIFLILFPISSFA